MMFKIGCEWRCSAELQRPKGALIARLCRLYQTLLHNFETRIERCSRETPSFQDKDKFDRASPPSILSKGHDKEEIARDWPRHDTQTVIETAPTFRSLKNF